MESKDSIEIHRAQGAIGAVDLIKKVKSDLSDYEADVAAKRCERVKIMEAPNAMVK